VQSPSYNVLCWGDELYGQVGDGQATDKVLPTSALLDSDRDGCTDNAELGTNQDLGGKRDPNNFWDFFDTPDSLGNRDRMVTQADKDRVNARVGTNGSTSIDPLSFPASGYRTAYDRTDDPGSSEAWDLLGPNGTISNSGTTNDVSLVNAQLNDTCT